MAMRGTVSRAELREVVAATYHQVWWPATDTPKYIDQLPVWMADVGYVDTDMTAHIPSPKIAPADVARQAIDGVEAGAYEVLADDVSRRVKAGLAGDLAALYPQLAA